MENKRLYLKTVSLRIFTLIKNKTTKQNCLSSYLYRLMVDLLLFKFIQTYVPSIQNFGWREFWRIIICMYFFSSF